MEPTVKFDPATGTLDIYDTRIKCINVYSRDGYKAGLGTGPYTMNILPAPEPEPEPEPAPAQEPELTDFQRMIKDAKESGDWEPIETLIQDEAENWEPDLNINDAESTADEWRLDAGYASIYRWSCDEYDGDGCDREDVYSGIREALTERILDYLKETAPKDAPTSAEEAVVEEVENLDYTIELVSEVADAIRTLEDYCC